MKLMITALLALPLYLSAAPILTPIDITLSVSPYDQQQHVTVHQPAQLALDASGTVISPEGLPLFDYNTQAVAEAFGGLRPTVNATAHASVTWHEGGADLIISEGYASAVYQVSIHQTALLPSGFQSAGIPVTVNFRGEVNGGATAMARMTFADDTLFYFNRITTLTGHSPTSFEDTRRVFLNTDSYVTIQLEALAQAIDHCRPELFDTNFSQAVADPLFTFDQETFDQAFGENSFPLADYFEFTYSPGTLVAPEPGSALLFLAGLAGCFVRRVRKESNAAPAEGPSRVRT
jgi:hypothetical protein